jgi:hypothetical protein
VLSDVRFTPKIGHWLSATGCPLCAKSRHSGRFWVLSLNKHVNAALADPTFKAKMIDLGEAPFANTPAGFGGFIAEW